MPYRYGIQSTNYGAGNSMRLVFAFGFLAFLYGCSVTPDKEELAVSGLYYGSWINDGEESSKTFTHTDINSASCNRAIIEPVVSHHLIFGSDSADRARGLERYRKSLQWNTHKGSYSIWAAPYTMNLHSALNQVDFEDQFELVIKTSGSAGFYSGTIDEFRYFDNKPPYWFDEFQMKAYKLGHRYLATVIVPDNKNTDIKNEKYAFIYRDMGGNDKKMCKDAIQTQNINSAIGSFLSIDTSSSNYSAYFYQVNAECEIVKVDRYQFGLFEGTQLSAELEKVFKEGYQQCQ